MKNIDFSKVAEIKISYSTRVKPSERPQISQSKEACQILKPAFSNCIEHHEEMYLMLLDRAKKVLGISNISKGGLAGTVMDNKIILQIALKANASSIILAHNHPSGNINPSQDDLKITKHLRKGCKAIDMHLADHLIITSESYFSFSDNNKL